MPSLNDDVLNEIFHETFRTLDGNTIADWRKNAQTLEKFMLAGKEPFKIALKNFAQASWIDISRHELIITVNSKVR